MELCKVLWPLIFKATPDGYNIRRALNGAYAAANTPILIDPGFIFNHFYRIYRTNFGAGATPNAFVQFGFANKIDRH